MDGVVPPVAAAAPPQRRASFENRSRWLGIAVSLAAVVVVLVVFHGRLWALKERDQVAYPLHVAAATVLKYVRASPSSVASQWLKAGYHARTDSETNRAVNGFGAAIAGVPLDELDPSLCSIFHDAPPGGWVGDVWPGALRDQYAVLVASHLMCSDVPIWGDVPDSMPITYTARPPTSGIFHATWYPTYGVAPELVPAATWLHNLAHGAVVVLYHCPSGCPEVPAQAEALRGELAPDLNPQMGGPKMLVTASDDIDAPIVVVAWGKSLQLDHFDRDQVADFFDANVDRGPECQNRYCPD
jgi:hypothetical protein